MSTLKQRLAAKQKLVRSQIDKLVRARRVAAKADKIDKALTAVLKSELGDGLHRGYHYTIDLDTVPENGLDVDKILANHSAAWVEQYSKTGTKRKLSVVKPPKAKAA